MFCPKCKSTQVLCTDSRPVDGFVYRRRGCLACGHRFSTYEVPLAELEELRAKAKRLQRIEDTIQIELKSI